MRNFKNKHYFNTFNKWDIEVINYLPLIHEYKGKQTSYIQQKPLVLNKLVEIAKVQSTEASNSIEGLCMVCLNFINIIFTSSH